MNREFRVDFSLWDDKSNGYLFKIKRMKAKDFLKNWKEIRSKLE